MNIYQVELKRYKTVIETISVTVQAHTTASAVLQAQDLAEQGRGYVTRSETDADDLTVERVDYLCRVGETIEHS